MPPQTLTGGRPHAYQTHRPACSVGYLGVLARDALEPATYTFGLEHVCIHGRVRGIVDGDTINLRIFAKKQIRVRIAFIDAQENGQAFGSRAETATSELVFGKDVNLRPHTIDRHGGLVARVLIDKIFSRPDKALRQSGTLISRWLRLTNTLPGANCCGVPVFTRLTLLISGGSPAPVTGIFSLWNRPFAKTTFFD